MTGNMRVYVFANSEPYYGSISASCNDNWVSINTSSGGYIYIEYYGNTTGDTRTALINITALGQTVTFTLEQRSLMVINAPLPYDGQSDGMKYININGLNWAVYNVGGKETNRAYIKGSYFKYGAGETTGAYDSTIPYTGTENPLDSSKDTATQVLGDKWRTPTKAEFESLISNCYSEPVLYVIPNGYDCVMGTIFAVQSNHNKFKKSKSNNKLSKIITNSKKRNFRN